MEVGVSLTPEEYIRQLGDLIASGDDRGALEFASKVERTVRPRLTPEQIEWVGGTLEGCAMAVAMEDAELLAEEESSAPKSARSG